MTTKRSVGVTDKRLTELGRAREVLRNKRSDLEKEQAVLDSEILKELKRRGTRSIEHGGVKVGKVEQPWTSYSYDRLRERLGKRAGRFRKREVDVAALSVAVQKGEVPTDIVDYITDTGTKAPYVSVSFGKQG